MLLVSSHYHLDARASNIAKVYWLLGQGFLSPGVLCFLSSSGWTLGLNFIGSSWSTVKVPLEPPPRLFFTFTGFPVGAVSFFASAIPLFLSLGALALLSIVFFAEKYCLFPNFLKFYHSFTF